MFHCLNACATAAALGLVLTLGSAAAQSLTFTPDADDALDNRIAAGEYGTVTSVMIMSDGVPVHSGWYNGASSASRHDTRSVTKTITGMVVGAAIADGFLTLDTPVADHFPELAPFPNPDPRKRAITVEDLLTMSGPLECNDWNEFSRGNEERMYLVEDWNAFFWSLPIRGYASWQTPPERSPHGRAFSYCTAGVQILGETVARASGQDFMSYARTRLFDPIGLGEAEWPLNGQGRPHLGGGLRLTTADLARLGELQREDGRHDGRSVLPAAWMQASVTPHAVIPDAPDWAYGYLWWLVPYEVEGETYWAAAMNGNGGNRVFVLADAGLTVVFTNADYNTRTMHENAARFFQAEIVGRLTPR